MEGLSERIWTKLVAFLHQQWVVRRRKRRGRRVWVEDELY